MLAIPTMKSEPAGQFDISPLSNYLRHQRCYDESQLDTDLLRFQSLRVQSASVSEPSDSTQQLQLSYLCHLLALAPRLSQQVVEHEVKLAFCWTDAFQLTKKNVFCSLLFEAAAVLWNVGALESLRGGRLDRSTDEGIRSAAKCFQFAAGCFEFIQTNILPQLGAVILGNTPCLSADCLNMVKLLMLAQAQLCFYEKAVRDKKKDLMKSAIIAKLASQVFAYYTQACTCTRAGSIVTILDVSWSTITDFQSKSFHAASEYWQGVASKEAACAKGSGYGEEVARYIRAEQYVRQAMEIGRKFSLQANLQNGAEGLLQAITTNRTQALQDLNSIYMEPVTPDHGLTEIPPVSMVKPAALSLTTIIPSDELMFKYILPRELIDMMRKFYDDVSKVHKKCNEQVVDATNLGRMTLSSVGLPGSLEASKSDKPLTDSLWNKVHEVQSKGGVTLLRDLYDNITRASRRALSTIQTIEESLDDAERKDEQFRLRFPSYSGQRVKETNQEIRVNVQKFKQALSNAQANDEVLRIEIYSEELSKLALSRDELTAQFPVFPPQLIDLDDHFDGKPAAFQNADVISLEEKLHELAALFESRQRDLDEIKRLGGIDLSTEINNALVRNENPLSLCQKYGGDLQQLEALVMNSVNQQEVILNNIIRLNEAFVVHKEADPVVKGRNLIAVSLEQSIGKFGALHAQVSAGQTFYSNLQSQLTTLQQNADDNAYTAQWQRQEFEASLNTMVPAPPVQTHNNFVNQFAATHISPPPPPPPSTQTYSAYPSFTSAPATSSATATPVTTSAYTPSVTTPTASPAYQYNQNSYSILSQPAPVYSPQASSALHSTPVHGGQPATAVPAPSPMNSYPGNPNFAMGQPSAAPPGYGTVGQSPPNYTPVGQSPPNYTPVGQSPPNYTPAGQSPPNYTPAQQSPPPLPPKPISAAEMDNKISRVMEMGFPKDKVAAALSATNWNEEAALNILLGITPEVPPGAQHPHGAAPAPGANGAPQSGHKTGRFSGFWGSKNK